MHNFLVDDPRMEREELWSWNVLEGTPTVLFRVVGDLEAYRERIAAVDSIESFDLTPIAGDSFYAFVRAAPSDDELEWMTAFYQSSIVLMPPVVYDADGEAVFEVLGDPDDLRGLLDELPDRVDRTIERVGEFDRHRSPAAALTGRQRDVVETAVELGYYDVPREATLEDVAGELDVAASTVSDHLRKAEAEVMTSLT